MIICNGVVGLCLLAGGLRHHVQSFRVEGANTGLAALIALSTLSLVLPTFTTSSAGRTHTGAQLAFSSVASLALWGTFVFVQTIRHRDYFLPPVDTANESVHAAPPSTRHALISFGLLLVCLIGVVELAKVLSPSIESGVAIVGAPREIIGIAIPLELGLQPKDMVLLLLTFLVSSITLVSGRTHVMAGAVHLVILAAFLFLALVP